jgi:hypothetical protein
MPVVSATQEAEDHSCPEQKHETFCEKQTKAKKPNSIKANKQKTLRPLEQQSTRLRE